MERLPAATVAREANGCRGRPAQGRSPCMEQGHVRTEDPEGWIPRRAVRAVRSEAARSAAAAAQRRLGGGIHVCPWGMVGVTATRGEMHGQDRVLFLCEKKATRPCVAPYLWASVCTRANTNTNPSCVGVVRVRFYPNSASQPGRPRKGRE